MSTFLLNYAYITIYYSVTSSMQNLSYSVTILIYLHIKSIFYIYNLFLYFSSSNKIL